MSSATGGIRTGGGAYIGGNASAVGDIIGRDQHIGDAYTRTTQQGIQSKDLAQLFQSVYSQVDRRAADPNVDTQILTDTAKKIEEETSKGEDANPEQVRKWLGTVARLAPDVLEVAVNVLTNPGAAVASTVRLVAREFSPKAGASDVSNS